jgi:hypothetical protein
VRAGIAKRDRDWDHTAETIASLGSCFTGQRISLSMCHPYRKSKPVNLDDPEAEYNRLIRAQATKNNGR